MESPALLSPNISELSFPFQKYALLEHQLYKMKRQQAQEKYKTKLKLCISILLILLIALAVGVTLYFGQLLRKPQHCRAFIYDSVWNFMPKCVICSVGYQLNGTQCI